MKIDELTESMEGDERYYLPNDIPRDLHYRARWTEDLSEHSTIAIALELQESDVKRLPNNLTVKGDLDLDHCESLRALPHGLKVGKHMYMVNTPLITTIPQDISVRGALMIGGRDCKINPLQLLTLTSNVEKVHYYGGKHGELYDLACVVNTFDKVKKGELRLNQAKIELSEALYDLGFGHLLKGGK